MLSTSTLLLVILALPAKAPVPPDPPPDPLARGYLGITLGDGTMISSVEAGMPAAKAGLQPGDLIVRIGSFEPQSFDQIVAHICTYRPGAIVEIEVQRGTTRKTVKVKLATRPARLDNPQRPPFPGPIDE
ncbi:MAG: PDZ domain-containing protein [Gemmataceae bacterium]|nr:PDZ domain-containing protein [Gemmata sp.]MDW8196106.1 PDZ domain-containing protein [Gemmataceae bacterium]